MTWVKRNLFQPLHLFPRLLSKAEEGQTPGVALVEIAESEMAREPGNVPMSSEMRGRRSSCAGTRSENCWHTVITEEVDCRGYVWASRSYTVTFG